MTWVDLIVLAVLAVSALLAFMRGLVREVLGLGAWAGAVFVAIWALPRARPQFQQWIGDSPWADLATFGAIFLITLIVLMIVSSWISGVVRNSPISGLDRSLGLVFGVVRGAALVVIAYIIAGMVVPVDRWPEPVLQARLVCPAYNGAVWTVSLVPPEHRPQHVDPPASCRQVTAADALLQATPQGRALGKPPSRD
jgi:membrane protein required for colicin V production